MKNYLLLIVGGLFMWSSCSKSHDIPKFCQPPKWFYDVKWTISSYSLNGSLAMDSVLKYYPDSYMRYTKEKQLFSGGSGPLYVHEFVNKNTGVARIESEAPLCLEWHEGGVVKIYHFLMDSPINPASKFGGALDFQVDYMKKGEIKLHSIGLPDSHVLIFKAN